MLQNIAWGCRGDVEWVDRAACEVRGTKKRLWEPVSGLSHLAGVLLAVAGLVVLLSTAAGAGRTDQILTFEIFGCSVNRAVRRERALPSPTPLSPPSVARPSWNRFNALNTASFVLAVATWLSGRSDPSGRGMDRRARNLGLAKDALMVVAGFTGLTVLILQIVLYRQAPEGAVPLETGGVPAADASGRASRLQRAVSALGSVHVALFAGLVALTTTLSAETGRSSRRSVLSRRGR